MEELNSIFVNGYRFGTEEDAELARMEQKKVTYFSEKLAGRNTESILAVYDKILDEKIFATPIGWEYLRELQQELEASGISNDVIRPVPMYVTFAHKEDEKERRMVKQRIRPSQRNNMKLQAQVRISIGVNILLVIMVIVMFTIAFSGNNPNVLNYQRVIENKYASWEQELSEREAAVREKEAENSQN